MKSLQSIGWRRKFAAQVEALTGIFMASSDWSMGKNRGIGDYGRVIMLVLLSIGFLLEIYCIRFASVFCTRYSLVVAMGFRMSHAISGFLITNGCKNGCNKQNGNKKGARQWPNPLIFMERETGFGPATSTLARLHSTTELFPQKRFSL